MKVSEKRALLPGTVLKERYILENVSGEGSFGITYIGWDLLLESRVAVKEFFPVSRVNRNAEQGEQDVYVFEEEDYEQSLRRYLEEGKRLSRLNQVEGIVSIRDFFYANHTAYIIMEYIEGVSLKTHIEQNGPMPGNVVMGMMSPVLDALEKVHENGIIHRDISPDNIIVTKDNKLVLVDFGSARQVDGIDRSLTVMVKRGYSSPEQYRSRGEQGAWSDVYAICATMYFMLSGKAPDEAIDRILDDETKSLLDMKEVLLSKKLKKAVMKGISLRYNERYQTVTELKKALRDTGEKEKELKKWWKVCAVSVLGLVAVIWSFWRFYPGAGEEDGSGHRTGGIVGLPLQTASQWLFFSDQVVKEMVAGNRINTVRVPDVREKKLAKAKKILSRSGLKCKVVRVESREKENTVVSQNEEPGKECEAGSRIVLQVSKGTPSTPAPSVRPPAARTPAPKPKPKPKPKQGNQNKYDGIIE